MQKHYNGKEKRVYQSALSQIEMFIKLAFKMLCNPPYLWENNVDVYFLYLELRYLNKEAHNLL